MRLGVLHQSIVHDDFGEVLVLYQLHHFLDVLLTKLIDLLIVLEPVQKSQCKFQGYAGEYDVDSTDLEGNSQKFYSCLWR